MNQDSGALYADVKTALTRDPYPDRIVSVPRSFAKVPRRVRPTAYKAMRAGGKAAKLLKGQRCRSGGR